MHGPAAVLRRAVFGRVFCDSNRDPLAAAAAMRYVDRAEEFSVPR